MYLYIIKFKKGDMFKVGITESLDSRVSTFMRVYSQFGISYDESFVLKGKKKDILVLEKQLLQDYISYTVDCDSVKNLDGYTELRRLEVFDRVLEDINRKIERFPKKKMKLEKLKRCASKKLPDRKKGRLAAKERRLKKNKIKLAEHVLSAKKSLDFLKSNVGEISHVFIDSDLQLAVVLKSSDIVIKAFEDGLLGIVRFDIDIAKNTDVGWGFYNVIGSWRGNKEKGSRTLNVSLDYSYRQSPNWERKYYHHKWFVEELLEILNLEFDLEKFLIVQSSFKSTNDERAFSVQDCPFISCSKGHRPAKDLAFEKPLEGKVKTA